MRTLAAIAKAVVAGLSAGLGALATAYVDNSVSPPEWVAVASAAVGALGAVWAIPNYSPNRNGE